MKNEKRKKDLIVSGVISCSDVGTKMFLLCHERDLFFGLLLQHWFPVCNGIIYKVFGGAMWNL